MSKKVLVTWITALLLLSIAIGTQAEGTEDTIFFFDTTTGVQTESAEDTIFSSGDWSCRVRSDGNLEIVEWMGKESELVIPATIDGKKVVAIGDGAFSRCYGLTSVTIPDSITSIGANPFAGCDALRRLKISPDHPTFALIDNALFYKPEKRLVAYLSSGNAKVYTIPQGILSIGNEAFYGCDNLTSITVPDSITSIGDSAFSWCDNLAKITIPDNITSIGNGVFEGCASLTNIKIPDSVTSIGDSAFNECANLTNITIPNSVTSIGINPFRGCDSLQIKIPSDHPTLALIDNALIYKPENRLVSYLSKSLVTIYEIPKGILGIGNQAFSQCDNLIKITIPEGVTNIGNEAFSECDNLNKVIIPEGVTSIGDKAFFGCGRLFKITIPTSVTSIKDGTFFWCHSLTNIIIPEGVTSIGKQAFFGCNRLKKVAIPASVTSIGEAAFDDCPDTIQLTVTRDSYARKYAEENDFSCNYPDSLDWINQ